MRLFIQPPRIAALLRLSDGVIGDGKSLFFGQPFLQATDNLASATPNASDGHLPTSRLGYGVPLGRLWSLAKRFSVRRMIHTTLAQIPCCLAQIPCFRDGNSLLDS